MNSRLTLCMTLHIIKGDKEFKNTNLETEGDQKFDMLNQYRTLQITVWTISGKIVATIENNLLKYVLRTCIYRSMITVVLAKMNNDQNSTIKKSQWPLLWWQLMLHVLSLPLQKWWNLCFISISMRICRYSEANYCLVAISMNIFWYSDEM